MNNTGIMPSSENVTAESFASNAIPVRKGARPKTIMGPLHIQCNGHGDPKYLKQLVDDVLTWPHIESTPSLISPPNTIPIRLEEVAASSDSSAFISARSLLECSWERRRSIWRCRWYLLTGQSCVDGPNPTIFGLSDCRDMPQNLKSRA